MHDSHRLVQSAEADHAEHVAQLQQQVQDFERQQAVLQTQLALQPKPAELQRQDLIWLHLHFFVIVMVFLGLCIQLEVMLFSLGLLKSNF